MTWQVGQSQGLITAQNILALDEQLGEKLLGAGAWDINFGFADQRSSPFFSDLAAAWSGPKPPPTPPNPPAPPNPPPASTPPPPPPPSPSTCGTWVEICPKCTGGSNNCAACSTDLSKFECKSSRLQRPW
jgi:hypothetical protein